MAQRYSVSDLTRWAREVLEAAGAPSAVAGVVARHLARSDAAGHSGHGVAMLPEYLRQAMDGRLVADALPAIVRELPSHLLVDGHHGFGHHTLEWTLERAIGKARTAGVCAANLTRCGHTGRLGEYGLMAANQGAAALICGGSLADPEDALVAPHGANEIMLGTNPIAYAHPADPPFVLDMATSAMAYYDLLQVALRDGRVSQDVLIDKAGRPTTEAAEILRGGAMLAFGGHKGFGLSVAAALLGAMSGAAVTGFFLLVIDPRVVGSLDVGTAALRELRALEKVVVPGDRARQHAEESRERGIAVSPSLAEQVHDLLRDMCGPAIILRSEG